ncbi:MAG TPA: septal ring lytic transglycosylase RlpA family protein [Stellaceae bacterium]|nr:septal ring lytic transglycosylase RlpA family protein [Stellaceae bacterium]
MPKLPSAGRALRNLLLVVAIGLGLAACGGPMGPRYAAEGRRHLIPHPAYKVGAPYTIKGVTYYPRVDYNYDETGVASWYGEAFDGQYTANGEVFDLNQVTAAHRTLPLPSIVEVTNLRNNRAMRVRVNDRGPFVDGRILDVSRRVAQLLGFEKAGTTQVRVRILKDESLHAAALAQRGLISDNTAPPRQEQVAAVRHGYFVEVPHSRMQVGPMATAKEAGRVRDEMIHSGYRDAQVVID